MIPIDLQNWSNSFPSVIWLKNSITKSKTCFYPRPIHRALSNGDAKKGLHSSVEQRDILFQLFILFLYYVVGTYVLNASFITPIHALQTDEITLTPVRSYVPVKVRSSSSLKLNATQFTIYVAYDQNNTSLHLPIVRIAPYLRIWTVVGGVHRNMFDIKRYVQTRYW